MPKTGCLPEELAAAKEPFYCWTEKPVRRWAHHGRGGATHTSEISRPPAWRLASPIQSSHGPPDADGARLLAHGLWAPARFRPERRRMCTPCCRAAYPQQPRGGGVAGRPIRSTKWVRQTNRGAAVRCRWTKRTVS